MGIFNFKKMNSNRISMNITEILSLSKQAQSCSDLKELIKLFDQKGDYNNPQIGYLFGVLFINFGDKERAKKALIKGANYGIKYPCEFYDTAYIDAIGQCFMLLATRFHFPIEKLVSLNCLAYVYLSRCIELKKREAFDSYRSRALLFNSDENQSSILSIIFNNIGLGVLIEPFVISDFYFASQAIGSPYRNAIQSANNLHESLDDIAIDGIDADDYSLYEIALIGENRHSDLFKKLEQTYKKGKLNFTFD